MDLLTIRGSSIDAGNSPDADSPMPGVRVSAFHGELDLSKKRSIEESLGELERFAPTTIAIVDLSDVQYLDTTFLNALLRTRENVFKRGGKFLRIVAPRGSQPARVFSIANLDATFEIFEDLTAATR